LFNTKAYSARSASSPLASTTIPRRDPTPRDVQIEILFCGICHSDLHQVRNEMAKHAGSFDFILDTIAADHNINAYLNLLAHDATLTLVGAPEKPLEVSAFRVLMGRRSLAGSLIGGIDETKEMLDYCGEHNITADVEVIPIQKVNEAYERLARSDVTYRFCIDMVSLKSEDPA